MAGIFNTIMNISMGIPQMAVNFLNRPFYEIKNMILIVLGVLAIAIFMWWFILWQ
jgi:hypothetical protein